VYNPIDDIIQQVYQEKLRAKEALAEEEGPEDNGGRKKNSKAHKIEKCLDHYATVAFMTLVTIYALFGDDLRILHTDKEWDQVFYGVSVFGIVVFSVEIILASYA